MNISAIRTIAMILAMLCICTAAATPGNPIGGIIVKGGKNPGGQMRALATTDRNGEFKIESSDAGEYKLVFEVKASDQSRNRIETGMELEYTMKPKGAIARSPSRSDPGAVRSTPFRMKIDRAPIVVVIPAGGGTLIGKIQSVNVSDTTNGHPRRVLNKASE